MLFVHVLCGHSPSTHKQTHTHTRMSPNKALSAHTTSAGSIAARCVHSCPATSSEYYPMNAAKPPPTPHTPMMLSPFLILVRIHPPSTHIQPYASTCTRTRARARAHTHTHTSQRSKATPPSQQNPLAAAASPRSSSIAESRHPLNPLAGVRAPAWTT